MNTLARPGPGGRRLLVASALLLFVAFPPFHLVFPSFVALVPLALFIAAIGPGPGSSTKALRGGLLFGLLYFGLLVHWIVPALLRTTPLAVAIYAAAVLVLAIVGALACWSLHSMHAYLGVPLWMGLPLAWSAGEWLPGARPQHFGIPLARAGNVADGVPADGWIGRARRGPRGDILARARQRSVGGGHHPPIAGGRGRCRGSCRPWSSSRPPASWGFWRARHLLVEPVGIVVVARTDFRGKPGETLSDLQALRAVDAALAAEGVGLTPPDLIVLPEGTFRDGLDGPDLVAGLMATSRRAGAPILFGFVRQANTGGHPSRYNSAALIGPEGVVGEPYDKRHLVPLIERLPFLRDARVHLARALRLRRERSGRCSTPDPFAWVC